MPANVIIIALPQLRLSGAPTNMKKNPGFTLIELLVAMAIIAILAAISLGSYQNTQRKARDAQRKADLKHLSNALEAYFNDKGHYPLDDAAGNLVGCGELGEAGCTWGGEFSKGTAPTKTIYMVKLPQDPTRYRYFYDASDDGISYQIYARLENSKDPVLAKGEGGTVLFYSNTSCSATGEKCNYGISSTNVPVESTEHQLGSE
jgi:prepilin-type N-terminal cleavage/methylation domain-containing protein